MMSHNNSYLILRRSPTTTGATNFGWVVFNEGTEKVNNKSSHSETPYLDE